MCQLRRSRRGQVISRGSLKVQATCIKGGSSGGQRPSCASESCGSNERPTHSQPRSIEEELPEVIDFVTLFGLSERWGREVRGLVYRSQELGIISESTARRAYIRLAQSPQDRRPDPTVRRGNRLHVKRSANSQSGEASSSQRFAEQLRWKSARVCHLFARKKTHSPPCGW